MRTTCGSRSSLACCRRCSLGDLLPAPAIALDAAARESLVPAASLRAHRPRHRCGHDGQRKRVAHMPTATTAEEDSSSKMVQNYPHDFTKRLFIITWWLRGHIIKEHLKLLRSQQDDLNAKLGKAKAELLDLEKHLATGASRITLSDHVISTARLFGDMQIIIKDMEATLAHLTQPRSDVE